MTAKTDLPRPCGKTRSVRASGSFQPFGELARLLPKTLKNAKLPEDPPSALTDAEKHALRRWHETLADPVPACDRERRLFAEAMADVSPLAPDRRLKHRAHLNPAPLHTEDPDAECLRQLNELVTWGKGFVIEQTPEYIQGTGAGAHPHLARRLHRGDFAIQAHIDLHGLSANQARQVVADFFKQALTEGKHAVLVVHGRGRCSSGEPVLKSHFCRWLTSGPWRKWVLAFASARNFDGGTGATYVLFRQKPLTGRMLKNRR